MTIKDIARISGYGVSTVSRALNGHPDISAQARESIKAVAEQYKFVPNANARQLKASSSKTVTIIVKGTFNVFFSALVENLQAEIDTSGYTVSLRYINTRLNEVELAQRIVEIEKPVGIIFLGGNSNNFDESFMQSVTVPCVLCSTSAENTACKNLSSVTVDDIAAGKSAIDYLIERGHRNIGIIGGDDKSFCAMGQRYKGAMKSFSDNGIVFDRSAFVNTTFDLESGYNAARQLFLRRRDLTAVFAMSDTVAIGAIRAAADLGFSVPDDISVIGFDGIEFSSFYNPRITTFVQPQNQIATITVRLLNQMITVKAKAEHILLKAEFQAGGSVKDISEGTTKNV